MAVDFPANPAIGDTVTDPANGIVWMWDGTKWTFGLGSGGGGGGGGGVSVEIGPTPPANPASGTLWWSTNVVKLYVWDGTEWVVVSNVPTALTGPEGPEGPEGPAGATGPQGPPGVMGPGITDGSNAAAGQIGEYLNSGLSALQPFASMATVSIQTLLLSPGDWDVTMFFLAGALDFSTDRLTQFFTAVQISPTAFPTVPYWNVDNTATTMPSSPGYAGSLGPIRFNVTAATTLNCVAFANIVNGGGSGQAQAQAQIVARRMR